MTHSIDDMRDAEWDHDREPIDLSEYDEDDAADIRAFQAAIDRYDYERKRRLEGGELMARITVYTDDGREVASMEIDDNQCLSNGTGLRIFGYLKEPLGWLGRALSDARIIQLGGDPERLSEKVMRLLAEKGQA